MREEAKHKLTMSPEARKLLLDRKEGSSFKIKNDDGETGRRTVSIRASKKMLWFLAYRLKEITGRNFSATYDFPDYIPIGTWDDGSNATAHVSENKFNGPYWIEFTLEFNEIGG